MVEDVHRPCAVYRYRLTRVDVLAYERLPGERTGWRKAALFLPAAAIGMLAGLFEDELGLWWWAAVAGLLLLWAVAGLAVFNWRIHRRARARAAREGRTEVEDRGDHLVIRSEAGTTRLADETIGRVVVTDAHVHVLWRGGSLIVPRRAFGSGEAMRGFGAAIDRRSMEAAP